MANFDLSARHPDPETEQAIREAIGDIQGARTCFLREVVKELNGNVAMKQHFIKFLERKGVGKYLVPLQEAGLNR